MKNWNKMTLRQAAISIQLPPQLNELMTSDEQAIYEGLKGFFRGSDLSESDFKHHYVQEAQALLQELAEIDTITLVESGFKKLKRVYDRLAEEQGFKDWNYGEEKWEEIGA